MANQGGSHEQHVKAGKQSHKNTEPQQASSNKDQSSSGARGGNNEQHGKAGQQSHKNKH